MKDFEKIFLALDNVIDDLFDKASLTGPAYVVEAFNMVKLADRRNYLERCLQKDTDHAG